MTAKSLFQRIGVVKLVKGSGDNTIGSFMARAKREQKTLRFLRLAAPKRFRLEIVRLATTKELTGRAQQLLASGIPAIEFILVNPFAESFLSRMDIEGKDNQEIWRVKTDILNFAAGLLKLSDIRERNRLNGILIGFHRRELLWNLQILGEHEVSVRGYKATGTGHDPDDTELHLSTGSDSQLAESIIAFYEAVKADRDTLLVTQENELRRLGTWPSLFKGNVVYADKHKSGSQAVKVLASAEACDGEAQWLHWLRSVAADCKSFKPTRLTKRNFPSSCPWNGAAFSQEFIHGVNGGHLLSILTDWNCEVRSLQSRICHAADTLIQEAFAALRDFRNCAIASDLNSALPPPCAYPWGAKLECALQQTRRIICPSAGLLRECLSELQILATELAAKSNTVFRDANIRNRLFRVATRDSTTEVHRWLVETPLDNFRESLRSRTHDIDFETCRYFVTEWDDPFHLLFCPFVDLRAAPGRRRSDTLAHIDAWWRSPADDEDASAMHATFLCRSLREFLRRLWYANVMPRTYQLRYGKEPRDHYLGFAKVFVEKIPSCSALDELVDVCWRERERLWAGIVGGVNIPIISLSHGVVRPDPHNVKLDRIAPGFMEAHDFQHEVVAALREVFDGMLTYVDGEVLLNDGRKRVDAVFFNTATHGFFYEVKNFVKCAYVFVECKNYSGKISNAEMDQLCGRFSRSRGKLGILCCRKISDRKLLIRRCIDAWKEGRGCVIIMEDQDIRALRDLARKNDREAISKYLHRAFQEVTLS